jgi:hypothetical protein
MSMFRRLRLVVAVATIFRLAAPMAGVHAADIATALRVAPATPLPAEPPAAPALLSQPEARAGETPEAGTDTRPPTPGLRFPTRILLLSGAAATDPRAFVVLGDSDAADAGQAASEEIDLTLTRPDDRAPATLAQSAAAPERVVRGPDPLAGTRQIDPATTGGDAEKILASLLPPRSDVPADWHAPLEPLHFCGEPRALAPCVPPPPCHPALPPQPYDLVGKIGAPTCGPIYRGPCSPRSAERHDGPLAPLHRACDRFFDCFYTPR